jgi:hypothetical protein
VDGVYVGGRAGIPTLGTDGRGYSKFGVYKSVAKPRTILYVADFQIADKPFDQSVPPLVDPIQSVTIRYESGREVVVH